MKIKLSNSKMTGKYQIKGNPLKAAFPKFTRACFKQAGEINKAFERYDMNKPNAGEMKNYPDVMPAYGHDTGNYVARYGMGSYQIQAVLKLDSRLDFEKLSKAVRLTIDAEPVLGSRFIEHDPPYWELRKNIDEAMLCSIEETENVDEAVNRFLASHLDMDHDAMVKVKLIRTENYDTLVLKLNHTSADGAGTKEYIHLLAQTYSRVCQNSEYVPKQSIRSRKDHNKLFQALGIKHPAACNAMVESPKSIWPFPWKAGGNKDITPMVVCKLPEGQLEVLSRYGKERGATVNDLLLAAFFRAMFKFCRIPYGIPMDIALTVDLRRFLPDSKAEAIRNFTGGVVPRISRVHHEPFEETLSRVVSVMNRKKKGNPGWQNATGAERAEKMNFYQFLSFIKLISKVSEFTSQFCRYCGPGLSNMGLISKTPLKFGDQTVTEAYILPPVVRAPGFLLVASSYNGILTLAAGYYKGSIYRCYMEKLLDMIKDELIKGCK